MPALYLLVNLAVISIPLAFSWHPNLRFAARWRDFLPGCAIVLIGFIAWDIPFAAAGIWGFNDAYTLGIRVAGLPLEEWMFFLCIPYACVFTYYSLAQLNIGRVAAQSAIGLTFALLLLCLVLLIQHPEHLYTSVTTGLTAVFLVWMLWRRPDWMGPMWVAYLVLLLPFVLTNGVLTGLDFWTYPLINTDPGSVRDMIVWYDNTQNLGIRLFSIPLDDFIYGFLLIGLNVALFEYFGTRRTRA